MTEEPTRWPRERLEALMRALGMRTLDLAAAVGCHQTTVETWLLGQHRPQGAAERTLERLETEAREKEAAAQGEAK